jgi:hypothetical protein
MVLNTLSDAQKQFAILGAAVESFKGTRAGDHYLFACWCFEKARRKVEFVTYIAKGWRTELQIDRTHDEATVTLTADELQSLKGLLLKEAQRVNDDGREHSSEDPPLRSIYNKLLEVHRK